MEKMIRGNEKALREVLWDERYVFGYSISIVLFVIWGIWFTRDTWIDSAREDFGLDAGSEDAGVMDAEPEND